MSSVAHDFTDYQVLVVGGTRGTGHTIATAFADAGASVTVTGTMMLRELYDSDLDRFEYETVNLARQNSIDNLAASVGAVDVLVLAAGANLPYGLPPSEQSFIAEAVRSGMLGPTFLTTRLRLKLSQSPVTGGGCVIQTGAVRRWLELADPAADSTAAIARGTERAADNCAGIGIRVNTIVEAPRGLLPRQYAPSLTATRTHLEGNTMVRTQPGQSLAASVADSALFLASDAAARITGQTLRVA